jgi:hypothetical protein
MMDILPSFASPIGWDLPIWWMSNGTVRSLLQIFKIIQSVSTGWIMLPFWSVGTLTLWKRRLVLSRVLFLLFQSHVN